MGLLGRVGKSAAVAGAAGAVVKRVRSRQGGRWGDKDNQAAAPETAGPASGEDAKLARLKQLGELKESGVLTDEEFQQQKSQILDG